MDSAPPHPGRPILYFLNGTKSCRPASPRCPCRQLHHCDWDFASCIIKGPADVTTSEQGTVSSLWLYRDPETECLGNNPLVSHSAPSQVKGPPFGRGWASVSGTGTTLLGRTLGGTSCPIHVAFLMSLDWLKRGPVACHGAWTLCLCSAGGRRPSSTKTTGAAFAMPVSWWPYYQRSKKQLNRFLQCICV